jgi:hypothetical protein
LKKPLGIAFALLFALVVAAGAGIASAGWVPHGGYQVPDYWFTGIDPLGDFDKGTPTVTQNSAQYVIYDSKNELFVITAHPNYTPYWNDPKNALTTTVVSSIQVYNPEMGLYENPVVEGTFQIPLG